MFALSYPFSAFRSQVSGLISDSDLGHQTRTQSQNTAARKEADHCQLVAESERRIADRPLRLALIDTIGYPECSVTEESPMTPTDTETGAVSQQLTRRERLLHAPEYRHVFRRGKCFRDALLRIHVAPSPDAWPRLGLVASRKVGDAVRRNLLKRRLRHLFRINKGALPGPFDVVIVLTPATRGASFDELQRVFRRFMEWLGRKVG